MSARDVLVVLLGSALIRMESDELTVGQTVDLLIKLLDREGYEIMKKEENLTLRALLSEIHELAEIKTAGDHGKGSMSERLERIWQLTRGDTTRS
jgi:hypothetical protein